MNKRIWGSLAAFAAAAVAAGGAGTAGADVAQTPVATGCSAGFARLSLDWLASQGPYHVPAQLDAAGNQDGYICARALPDAARDALCGPSCPVPVLYEFTDDDNPAAGA
jgi:hypothetical protein